MNTKTIVSAISLFAVLLFAACDSGQSMMHGNNSMGIDNLNYNWLQIVGGFLGGLVVGFLLGRRTGEKDKTIL